MKKNGWIMYGVLATLLAVQTPAWSEDLRLDESVVVTGASPDDEILRAFRSQTSCRIWSYIPGRLVSGKRLLHTTGPWPVKIGNQHLLGLISAIELQVSPGVTPDHLGQLKEKIAQYLRTSDSECKQPEVKASDIVLNPALVKIREGSQAKQVGGRSVFSLTRFSYETDQTVYVDPNSATSVTTTFDATSPSTRDYINKQATKSASEPVEIGRVRYMVSGIVSRVDSRLTLDIKMDADFESKIQNTGCSVHTGGKNLNAFGAALSVAGAGIGTGDIGYSETSTTCTYNLMTEFKGGKYKGKTVIDHTRTRLNTDDGKPIVIQTCADNKRCSPIPLEDFLNTQLLAQMMMQNFDIIVTKVSEGTFNVTLGRQGHVHSDLTFDAEYLRSFHGTFGIEVPVLAKSLSIPDLNFAPFSSQLAQCAQRHYEDQLRGFGEYVQSSPLPIAPVCLSNGGTN